MTREELQQDYDQHKAMFDQVLANANAIKGAMEYISMKIKALDEQPRIVSPSAIDVVNAAKGKK